MDCFIGQGTADLISISNVLYVGYTWFCTALTRPLSTQSTFSGRGPTISGVKVMLRWREGSSGFKQLSILLASSVVWTDWDWGEPKDLPYFLWNHYIFCLVNRFYISLVRVVYYWLEKRKMDNPVPSFPIPFFDGLCLLFYFLILWQIDGTFNRRLCKICKKKKQPLLV